MRPLWRAGCSGPAGASRLVKDVVVAVPLGVHDDAGRLEEVGLDRGAEDGALLRDVDLRELAEARRVAVEVGLGVPKRLEQRVGHHEERAELHRRLGHARLGEVLGHVREVLQHQLARLRLARAGGARDDDGLRARGRAIAAPQEQWAAAVSRPGAGTARARLAVSRAQQQSVHAVGDGVDVRRLRSDRLAQVALDLRQSAPGRGRDAQAGAGGRGGGACCGSLAAV